MSDRTLTALDHLIAVFGPRHHIENLGEELRIAARHHEELAQHLRSQLGAGAYDAPGSLITPRGAVQLAGIHDTNAASSTAMANAVHAALWPETLEDNQ